ncbi:polysaccharide pyruvyl transferase family protein [Nocardia transvalensis]|uniref:polysaccharide pyruvyl transferase family protein n=1 Tax=Nocardia transvalensis TaxID=37333 RepID=UPI001895E8EB|nr:polysaccharide pyruvyl transferase family protein [Nocardia transvalensis]MBF6327887.1 polysaccharide pyruvyl transferase family protein [Nocardia transvalensis]
MVRWNRRWQCCFSEPISRAGPDVRKDDRVGKFGAASRGGEIRVLIENGEYWLRNRGDIAMMAVTVQRLREHWPAARVGILTDQPRILPALLPQAEPVCLADGGRWHRPGAPARLASPVALRWRAATDGPKAALRALRRRGRDAEYDLPEPPLPEAVADATLVLAQGGGYLTDVDRYQAHRVLNLLEHARSLGIPTAMIGQGVGPIEDPRLLERAAQVLPRVGFIALREGRRGPRLLTGLGVPADRIMVTGDDAVELAYRLRRETLGTDLGICLRVADYARVSASARTTLGTIVRTFAAEADAALAPLIISEYDSEDRRCTLPLLTGAARTRRAAGRGATAADVARQVSRCRVVVTSAYHLAVFALSQGIPAVGITVSRYYDDKFHGLAEMFGTGLHVVDLDDPKLAHTLTAAIRHLWAEAPALRDPLQARAVAQIDAARTGLDRVFRLVEGETTTVPAQGDR